MKAHDIPYILSLIILIFSVIVIIFRGKKIDVKDQKTTWFLKASPIISVMALIITTFSIYSAYKLQLKEDEAALNSITREPNEINRFINEEKHVVLDSLRLRGVKLENIESRLKKTQAITGQGKNSLDQSRILIKNTQEEINKILSYNDVIEYNQVTNQLDLISKGYLTSGNTNTFAFTCPHDTSSESLDLHLKFYDSNLVNEIAFIYVDIVQQSNNKETPYSLLYRQTYKPQKNINNFAIKNYLKSPNTVLSVGYFLRSEMGKSSPRFEKVSCRSPNWKLSDKPKDKTSLNLLYQGDQLATPKKSKSFVEGITVKINSIDFLNNKAAMRISIGGHYEDFFIKVGEDKQTVLTNRDTYIIFTILNRISTEDSPNSRIANYHISIYKLD